MAACRSVLLYGLLLAVGPVCCQEGQNPYVRSFPQWLTGIIAVSVFLFIVLVLFVVNRIWCGRKRKNELPMVTEREVNGIGLEGQYSKIKINQFRSKEHENAYENQVDTEAVVMSTPM